MEDESDSDSSVDEIENQRLREAATCGESIVTECKSMSFFPDSKWLNVNYFKLNVNTCCNPNFLIVSHERAGPQTYTVYIRPDVVCTESDCIRPVCPDGSTFRTIYDVQILEILIKYFIKNIHYN